MAVRLIRATSSTSGIIKEFRGLSTDVKPTVAVNSGSLFYELDTKKTFEFSAGNTDPVLAPTGWWVKK